MAYEHWEYFLALDADLERAARFVEFSPSNFTVYSIEFVRLLLAAGSEIDVVAKAFCKRLDPSKVFEDINDYRATITTRYLRFHEMKATIPRYGLTFTPWSEWASGKNPPWWRAHNKVKHERDSYYPEANLDNSLSAIAGLFTLLLYFYQSELYAHRLLPWPRLLALHSDHYHEFRMVGEYRLPDFGSSDTGSEPVHGFR